MFFLQIKEGFTHFFLKLEIEILETVSRCIFQCLFKLLMDTHTPCFCLIFVGLSPLQAFGVTESFLVAFFPRACANRLAVGY